MAVTSMDWPTGSNLLGWLGGAEVLSAGKIAQLDDIVAAATAIVVDACDPNKVPADAVTVPRPVGTAILLWAARLASRPDSPLGVVAFQQWATDVATVDPDIDALLAPYRPRKRGIQVSMIVRPVAV